MKALTLYEPWASAIAEGFKDKETRGSLLPGARGLIGKRLAVHAGRKIDESVYAPFPVHPGCIVATAVVEWIGLVTEEIAPEGVGRFVKVERIGQPIGVLLNPEPFYWIVPVDRWGDFGVGRWLYGLEAVRKLNVPAPVLGHQGLWIWRWENGEPVEDDDFASDRVTLRWEEER